MTGNVLSVEPVLKHLSHLANDGRKPKGGIGNEMDAVFYTC